MIEPWFSGRTVIVVGGTGSIGSAIARRLEGDGAHVIIAANDVTEEDGNRMRADISTDAGVVSLFERLDEHKVHALVNAAGVGVFKKSDEFSGDDWEFVMNTNAAGVFYCCREAIRRMRGAGGGRIVSIGSISTEVALPENALYAASKACVKTLSRVINEEYKDANIRSSVIHLGAVSSRVWDSRPEFDRVSMLSPADVAHMVSYILALPLNIRIDELILTPSKGIL
jgi:NAD(P)-dependent dehydrogenase (short-subunit alcohol dehydrogenase family)